MVPSPVLVTGAAGFIGSHLVEALLEAGAEVTGLDNFCDFYDPAEKRRHLASAMTHPAFTLVEADLRDAARLSAAIMQARPRAIVHLAAMAGVRPSIEHPALYTAVNLDGTVNLLEAAVASGVDRFLFASSSSVYGNHETVPFSETDPVAEPISPYAATKRGGELLCHTYSHLHGLPVYCLRFFTVYGPRQRPDLAIARFLNLAAAGERLPVYGDGSASRDYTYVGDIVRGVSAALQRCGRREAERFRIYNLGGSEPVSLRQLIETIGAVVGRRQEIEHLPPRPGDVRRTWADLARSERELGYRPATRLAEGIAHQWGWLKQRHG